MGVATVAMGGEWTQRYELTLRRVVEGGPPAYTEDFVLADAVPVHRRRFTNFSGDVSGRYIEALSAVARQTGREFPSLHRIVEGAIKAQKADGHWGDAFSLPEKEINNSDMALLWGNGRMLVGLMEYHALTKREDVLAAARRLGDFFVAVAPRLNTDAVQKKFSDNRVAVGFICWTQVVEGLVELARATGEGKYGELAGEIAGRTEYYPSGHSHGYVTALRGILNLHGLTGEKAYLDRVTQGWQKVVDAGNVSVHGALPEAFVPLAHRDEGCSEADWLRLNLNLWRVTGQAKYLEQADLTLFNEFAFNEFHTGDFGHHTYSAGGVTVPAARAWWCCTFHGLRAFPEVARSAFTVRGKTVSYDVPVDGEVEVEGLALRATSSLERDGTVEIEVVKADGKERTFEVRMPSWGKHVEVKAKGAGGIASHGDAGSLLTAKEWKAGDRVVVTYQMKTRMVREPGGGKRVAFFRGPWLLGVDEERSPNWFDEPHSQNRIELPKPGEDGEVTLSPSPEKDDAEPFTVPAGRAGIRFFPGGYPMQPQTAVLRPIAEKTGARDNTSWEFWFTPKE